MVRGRGNFLRSRYLSTAPENCLFVRYLSGNICYFFAVHVFGAKIVIWGIPKDTKVVHDFQESG